MSAGATDFPTTDSLAVLDSDVARIVLGRDLRAATVQRLRERGEWPPCFHVAGRSYVLRSDIARFIQDAKQRTDEKRIARQEKGRKAVEARWSRHRAAQAAGAGVVS